MAGMLQHLNSDRLFADVITPDDLPNVVPARGQTAIVTTRCAFSAWAFVPLLIRPENGHGKCERCTITTYNLAFDAVASLEQAIADDRIEVAQVIVSENLQRVGDGGAVYAYLTAIGEKTGRLRWARARVHAKTIGLRMASGLCYTVIGSGNMAHNTAHEAYAILTDRETYLHLVTWAGEIAG